MKIDLHRLVVSCPAHSIGDCDIVQPQGHGQFVVVAYFHAVQSPSIGELGFVFKHHGAQHPPLSSRVHACLVEAVKPMDWGYREVQWLVSRGRICRGKGQSVESYKTGSVVERNQKLEINGSALVVAMRNGAHPGVVL